MSAYLLFPCPTTRALERVPVAQVTVWWTTTGPIAEVDCPCGDHHAPDVCRHSALALQLAGAGVVHDIDEMGDPARRYPAPLSKAWIDDEAMLMGEDWYWRQQLRRLADQADAP